MKLESMRPTMDSRNPQVREANQIVAWEAFRILRRAQTENEVLVFRSAQRFLNGTKKLR